MRRACRLPFGVTGCHVGLQRGPFGFVERMIIQQHFGKPALMARTSRCALAGGVLPKRKVLQCRQVPKPMAGVASGQLAGLRCALAVGVKGPAAVSIHQRGVQLSVIAGLLGINVIVAQCPAHALQAETCG